MTTTAFITVVAVAVVAFLVLRDYQKIK